MRLTADGTLAVSTLARAGVLPLVSEAYGDVGVHVELAPGRTPLLRAKLELRELITHVTEFTVLVSLMGVGLAIDRTLNLRSWTSWRASRAKSSASACSALYDLAADREAGVERARSCRRSNARSWAASQRC